MIDEELLRVVGAHLGASVVFASPPTAISGGFWAAIYGFEIVGGPAPWSRPLVLRVMPDRVAGRRETAVQRSLAEHGFRTPVVLADGFDEALGGAYIVMSRAAGRSPMSGLDLRRSLAQVPGTVRRLPQQLAEVTASLHALDIDPVVAALAALDPEADHGTRPGSERGRVHSVERRLASVREAGRISPSFVELADWLDRHRPSTLDSGRGERVVCHGDIHPFNLLVDDVGTVTVLDWTNADVAPRELDVGFTAGLLRCAPMAVPRPAQAVLRRVTNWLADDFIRCYAAVAPLDHTMLAWFEVLQYARCLAEVATARIGATAIVHADHPFEISAAAMIRRLAAMTAVTINLGPRRPVPAS